jgi:D-serine deaminase-like pyridoxal phosphate-dependent protein
VLVDLDIVQANISKFQAHCDTHGLNLRPHIKTHKIPKIAKMQLAAGAVGITCQKISEAEAMIEEGGIEDVLITFNILGRKKLDRLCALADKVNLTVIADNDFCVDGLTDTFAAALKPLSVLVECDTGAGRCGVTTPQAAADLAQHIDRAQGVRFAGLMTYPPAGGADLVQEFLSDAKSKIESLGIAVDVVSGGGSPDMWRAQDIPVTTEYRIGTYVYNDASLQARGVCDWSDCALAVLATVISCPTANRAVIDAGSKVLTSDLLGLAGHGHVLGMPDLDIHQLSEEHGCIISDGPTGLSVGDRVRIVPNHACVVSNMLDHVMFVRGAKIIGKQTVTARGAVW